MVLAAGRLSLMVPRPFVALGAIEPWAGLAAEHPVARLWTGTAGFNDPVAAFAYAAGRGHRLSFGLAVGLTPLTGPHEAAARAAALAATTGRTFCLGVGPGSVEYQRTLLGAPYERPVQACVDYLRVVRERLAATARHNPAGAGQVELGLGVLRARMAAAAGEHADFAITWMCPPDHLAATIVPQIRAGERRSGNGCRVVAMVPVALSGGSERERVAAACGTHLSAPHYRAALAEAGISVGPTDSGDLAALLAADLVVTDSERAGAVLERYFAAGADEVVLSPLGTAILAGDECAVADCRRLMEAVAG